MIKLKKVMAGWYEFTHKGQKYEIIEMGEGARGWNLYENFPVGYVCTYERLKDVKEDFDTKK